MKEFKVPTKEQVSEGNQLIFDALKQRIGFVPNLYATMAHSENGLSNYLQFQNGKSSFSKKEKEVINLVVSEINDCKYCLAAHTAIGKLNGFTDEEIKEIRSGNISFNPELNVLAQLARQIIINKGKPHQDVLQRFFDAGFNKENLVDLIMAVGDKVIMNYLHGITQVPIDFPAISDLQLQTN